MRLTGFLSPLPGSFQMDRSLVILAIRKHVLFKDTECNETLEIEIGASAIYLLHCMFDVSNQIVTHVVSIYTL